MFLIVGLGNPEYEGYKNTRHNAGFNAVNLLAEKYDIKLTNKAKFMGEIGEGTIEGKKVILLKPGTYMNLSGQAIKVVMDFYKIDVDNLIVLYDDVDFKTEEIKIRKKGGPGTHNGLKSVVYEIDSTDFARVRIGIGNDQNPIDMMGYVIGKLDKEEQEKLNKGIKKAAEAVEEILKTDIDKAMNKLN